MDNELIELAMKLNPDKFTVDMLIGLISNIPNISFAMYEVVCDDNNQPIDLRAFYVNNKFLRDVKKTASQVIGRLFSEVIPKDIPFRPFFIKVAQSGEPHVMERYSETANIHINITAFSPGRNQVCTIIVDRTQFVIAERKAAEKEQNLSGIISMADAGFIVKDKHGKVTEWNIGAENILGYKPDEIIGKTTYNFAPQESHSWITEVTAKLEKGEHITHAEVVRRHKDGRLIDCSISYTPIFDRNGCFAGSVAIFHDITSKKQIELALNKANMETEEKHKIIMSGLEYSSKIQRSLLPPHNLFEHTFADYSIIWKPKNIVGGDIYWLKSFKDGALLCVCDCTGHGIPGALLTMLVASTLNTTVNESNYKDTAQIIYLLDKQISSVLNAESSNEKKGGSIKDGCDLAIVYVSNDGSVTISSGRMCVFICDGKEVMRIKGQLLSVGEGKVRCKSSITVTAIPPNPNNKFYIASDGLIDQPGGHPRRPFGYKELKQIILDNHDKSQAAISDKIWEAFESHRGDEIRRDDVELITFRTCVKPKQNERSQYPFFEEEES